MKRPIGRDAGSLTVGAFSALLLVHCGGAGGPQKPGTTCDAAQPSCTAGFICLNSVCEDALGKVWTETENSGVPTFTGTWTRLGTTNEFSGVWTSPEKLTSEVIISVNGYDVRAQRLGVDERRG
jgi:hypothetical protein